MLSSQCKGYAMSEDNEMHDRGQYDLCDSHLDKAIALFKNKGQQSQLGAFGRKCKSEKP